MVDQTLDDAATESAGNSINTQRQLTPTLIPPMTPIPRNEALDGDGTSCAYT